MRLFSGTKWDIPPTCDRCGQILEDCECPPLPEPPKEELPPEKQNIRIQKEKRKKGKVVTTISGFQFANSDTAKNLLKELKDQCGSGGTIESEDDSSTRTSGSKNPSGNVKTVLVIQGDQVERLLDLLARKGFRVRRVGG